MIPNKKSWNINECPFRNVSEYYHKLTSRCWSACHHQVAEVGHTFLYCAHMRCAAQPSVPVKNWETLWNKHTWCMRLCRTYDVLVAAPTHGCMTNLSIIATTLKPSICGQALGTFFGAKLLSSLHHYYSQTNTWTQWSPFCHDTSLKILKQNTNKYFTVAGPRAALKQSCNNGRLSSKHNNYTVDKQQT